MTKYKHAQVGYLMWYVLLGIGMLFGYISLNVGIDRFMSGIMIFVIFIIISFSSLEVKIDEVNVYIKFGYGIFRKKFPLKEIITVNAVKNSWYHGWGIRIWFWPRMVIFNVSGYDAIEIKMKNGKIYRIGTDEPQILEGVLQREIQT